MTTKAEKEKYYVDPEKFKNSIKEYYVSNQCTHYLGECLNKIAEGLGYNPKFINYSYKEEMIGDALIKMFGALKGKKYNIESESSPFGYFTTIAFHAFINRIKKEKRHHDAITEYRDRKYEEILCESDGHIYVKPILSSEDFDDSIDN
jgi:hypothetical protein